uniref:Uncharacterized protein n=1 Tax=Oryza punctata TaxID=4537 RepID=A0A0E0LYR8_ORYPU
MAPADHPFCSISGDAGSRAAATPPLPGIACALEFTTVVVGASARLDLSLHPRRRVLLHACCSAARAGMASSVSGAEHLDCEAQHDPFVDRRSEDDTSSVDCEARRNISLDKAAPGVSTLMRKWSKLSKKAMRHIDFSLEGNPPVFEPLEELTHLDSIEKVLETVRILHLSYDKGVFKHSPIKRPVTWDPIDEGEGDTDVVGIPNYSSNNYNENLDHKRRDKKKNRRKEKIKDNTTVSHVRGGQPGGAPASKDLELLQCWKSCQEVVYSSAKACSKPFCSMRQIYSQPNYIQKRNFSSMRISGRGHLLKFAQSIEAPRTTQNTKRAVILPENRLINCDMGMPKDPLCNMARGHITKTSKYRHVRLKTEVKEKITSLQIHEQFVCLKWASRDLHLVTQTSLKAHSECISMMDRVLKWTNIQFLRYSMSGRVQAEQSSQKKYLGPLRPQRKIAECQIPASCKRKGLEFIARALRSVRR